MSNHRKLYWDTTCFICFLNDAAHEQERHYICDDILSHAARGEAEIWTSSFTLVEVVRPRDKFSPKPFPAWVNPVLEKFPKVEEEIRRLWDFFGERTRPTRALTADELLAIQQLLDPRLFPSECDPLLIASTAALSSPHSNGTNAPLRRRGYKPASLCSRQGGGSQ